MLFAASASRQALPCDSDVAVLLSIAQLRHDQLIQAVYEWCVDIDAVLDANSPKAFDPELATMLHAGLECLRHTTCAYMTVFGLLHDVLDKVHDQHVVATIGERDAAWHTELDELNTLETLVHQTQTYQMVGLVDPMHIHAAALKTICVDLKARFEQPSF
ncbi:hypothetical protein AC1031_013455 [Aphanomyces cochlioides]|nr:hypothetical protein AC1031_013455 [Aphanomyces cochlioides]